MIAQAAGFALLAAISPTSLIVMAIFLGAPNPRLTALSYVIGAMIMTVVMAIVVLYILRTTGLNLPREAEERYGLRLGLGVLALASGAYVARHGRADTKSGKPRQGLMYRLVSQPSPKTAFGAGVLLFAPSTTFIAAVQVVATSRASVPLTALTLIIVVLITCLVVWLPLLFYLAAPDATTRHLKAINDGMRKHARRVGAYALGLCGVILVINGSLGLAGVI
jgi:threonine/homoserine/homoserine lactone efflux protein